MNLAARVTPVEYVEGTVVVWAQITQGQIDCDKDSRFWFKCDGKPLEGFEHVGNMITHLGDPSACCKEYRLE